MRTSRPFSSISYNTLDWITSKLNELVEQGHLLFWAFIEHFPEEEEAKKHLHVFCMPSGLFDTSQIKSFFAEPVPQPEDPDAEPIPPLGWLPCVYSNFQDWYLYALHDSNYLAAKHQIRKYHYRDSDIHCSSPEFLRNLVDHIDWSRINPMGKIIQAAVEGQSFQEFIVSNPIPIVQFSSAQKIFSFVQLNREEIGQIPVLERISDWEVYLADQAENEPS